MINPRAMQETTSKNGLDVLLENGEFTNIEFDDNMGRQEILKVGILLLQLANGTMIASTVIGNENELQIYVGDENYIKRRRDPSGLVSVLSVFSGAA